MAHARSKRRRDQRYEAAVRRQIALVNRFYLDDRRTYLPADVEEFLRPGDTVDMFRNREVA